VMTTTLGDVTARKKKPEPTPEEAAALGLVRRAREQGLSLTGPGGLLRQPTKTVLETTPATTMRTVPDPFVAWACCQRVLSFRAFVR
jgi:hypothetical protein